MKENNLAQSTGELSMQPGLEGQDSGEKGNTEK